MTKRTRNYAEEYRRRVDRGIAKGLSRSQARGHPKAKETLVTSKKRKGVDMQRAQIALKDMRRGGTLKSAAQSSGMSVEQLRRYLGEHKIASWKGRRWVFDHKLPAQWTIYTDGKVREIVVYNAETNAFLSRYHNDIQKFIKNNDDSFLVPYEDATVTDAAGKVYPLEADPNDILELLHAEDSRPEDVYKLMLPS